MIKNIGIIGDGQLAKMIIEAGISYNLKFYVYPLGLEKDSICKDIATLVFSYEKLFALSDIVTYEFEGIDTNELQKYNDGNNIIPRLNVLELIQSKVAQKEFYIKNNIPTSLLYTVNNGTDMLKYLIDSIEKDDTQLNNWVLKTDKGGYNGQGVLVLYKDISLDSITEFLNTNQYYLLEKKINLKKELAVMAYSDGNDVKLFKTVEMVFTDTNVLKYQFSPANISTKLNSEVIDIVTKTIKLLDTPGLFGVELFLDDRNTLYINEISPRPHNSGHHTIHSAVSSQFDVLIKILMGINISNRTENTEKDSVMINLLGPDFTGQYKLDMNVYNKLISLGCIIYDYGKVLNKPNRKMGHITYIDTKIDPKQAEDIYKNINSYKLIIPNTDMVTNHRQIDVGVIMGSISDADVVQSAIDILNKLDVSYEYNIVSAHRMPREMLQYADTANKRGLKVIIACAGGAAHLPGMVASMTTLPVIGLPVKTSTMNGLDSLYSIVQMPRGIPVATVAINNGCNAALLACRILAIQDTKIKAKLDKYNKDMNLYAIETNKKLNRIY